jgi:hypothetical protein
MECEAILTVEQEPGQLSPYVTYCGKPGKLCRNWAKPFGIILCPICEERWKQKYG